MSYLSEELFKITEQLLPLDVKLQFRLLLSWWYSDLPSTFIPLSLWHVDFSVSALACSPLENIDVDILEMSFVKRVLTYSDDPF